MCIDCVCLCIDSICIYIHCLKSLFWLNMSLKLIPYFDFVVVYFILYKDDFSIDITRVYR